MREKAPHLTVVVGETATAQELRHALEAHGVDHAAVIAHVGSMRRRLVLGEYEFVIVCIALDEPTMARHGPALQQLLSDHECFPTRMRTVGLLTDLGFTREVAELGCDVYVDNSTRAAEAVRLLDDARGGKTAEQPAEAAAWSPIAQIRGGWMCGTPQLPATLTSLIPTGPARRQAGSMPPLAPRRTDRSGQEFGDPLDPP